APLQIRRFQLIRAAREDVNWLQRTLDRESRQFGTRVRLAPEGWLHCPGRASRSASLASAEFFLEFFISDGRERLQDGLYVFLPHFILSSNFFDQLCLRHLGCHLCPSR